MCVKGPAGLLGRRCSMEGVGITTVIRLLKVTAAAHPALASLPPPCQVGLAIPDASPEGGFRLGGRGSPGPPPPQHPMPYTGPEVAMERLRGDRARLDLEDPLRRWHRRKAARAARGQARGPGSPGQSV